MDTNKKQPAYSVQVIESRTDGINYRITQNDGDNRIATCYLPEHANLVCNALNAHVESLKYGIVNNMVVNFVKNEIEPGFKAYFVDRPDIISEGETEAEASKNLSRLYKEVILHENKKRNNDFN